MAGGRLIDEIQPAYDLATLAAAVGGDVDG
jgi:hypothetical protein